MNHRQLALLAIATLAAAAPASAELKLPRPSPKASVSQTIGLTDVSVAYSRPGVKGRQIWGSLVPYDEPWRTGANEATTVTFSEDVTINGQKLAAGTYGFLTLPGKESWTVVFNKEKDLWGTSGYKQENDALRVQVKPETVAENHEWLEYSFQNLKTSEGQLIVRWEKLRLPLTIATDDLEQSVASARTEVDSAKADDWRTPYRAADFLNNNGLEPALAAQWSQKSVEIEPGYLNLTLLAKIKAKEGKKQEAIRYAQQAIKAGKEGTDKMDTRPTERLLSEWSASN